jgi:oxysterol-binding protein-related protein 9/10/11
MLAVCFEVCVSLHQDESDVLGSLYISVADTAYVTCPQTKTKVILNYLEDGWITKAQNRVEGLMYTYDPENDNKTPKIKDIPEKDIIARIEGSWTDKLYYSLGSGPFSSAEVSFCVRYSYMC